MIDKNGIYQIEGTERVEVTRDKVECGDAVKTSYYEPVTGELLRRDVNIEVSEEFMKKIKQLVLTSQKGRA